MVSVTLSDFTIEPATISVPAGAELMFHVESAGQSVHPFAVVVGSKTLQSPMIDAGGTGDLRVPALEAGTYPVLCTVPGHDQLGMKATVIAAEDAATVDGAAADTSSTMTAQEMADMYKAGVEAFPAARTTARFRGRSSPQPTATASASSCRTNWISTPSCTSTG